jgi:CHASE2 domain-containing sensor protein
MQWTGESKRFITVGILSALLSFAAVNLTPLYWLSERVTDGLLRKFRQVSHPDLTLVVIDDESLRALGRFPFDRTVYARMLDRLKAAGAKVVAFDILFVEPTPSDKILAEAMRRFGKVILGVNLSLKSEGKVPKRFLLSLDFPLPLKVAGATLPPEPLLSACYSLGFVYPFPDRDGVCRSLPLAVELTEAGGVIPSLSLAAVMAFIGEPQMSPNSIRWRNRVIQLGSDWDIPVLPPFSPERVGFPSISLVKVLEGGFDPELVRGKLVLVGMGASGLSDRLPTSTDPLAYGVEIHGAAIKALLTGKFPKHIPFWLQVLIALFVLHSCQRFLAPSPFSPKPSRLRGLDACSLHTRFALASVGIRFGAYAFAPFPCDGFRCCDRSAFGNPKVRIGTDSGLCRSTRHRSHRLSA